MVDKTLEAQQDFRGASQKSTAPKSIDPLEALALTLAPRNTLHLKFPTLLSFSKLHVSGSPG